MRIFQAVQKKKKDVDGIMTGVSVRKILTMFVQSSSILLFLNLLRRGGRAFKKELGTYERKNTTKKYDEMKKNEREAS